MSERKQGSTGAISTTVDRNQVGCDRYTFFVFLMLCDVLPLHPESYEGLSFATITD